MPEPNVVAVERTIEDITEKFGFPKNEEFKWSPPKDAWMRSGLKGERRTDFFAEVMAACRAAGALAAVCLNDSSKRTCTGAVTHEADVTTLLFERIDAAASSGTAVLVFLDRPGGGRPEESRFIEECMATIRDGTRFRGLKSLAPAPVVGESRHHRLLQVADVIVSAVGSYIGGEMTFSPPTFEAIRPLLRETSGRIGGVGLKIHPDFRYANLYHWLLGDTHFWRLGTGVPLPLPSRPYATGPRLP